MTIPPIFSQPSLLLLVILITTALATLFTTRLNAQQQQQPTPSSSSCTCCCPRLNIVPELHSIRDELLGSQTPDTFSASFFTGQRQSVLPSRGLVTITAEPLIERSPAISSQNNCSWSTTSLSPSASFFSAVNASPSSTYSSSSPVRCSVSRCTQHWHPSTPEWSFVSLTGKVPDLLSTGLHGISPSVRSELQESAIEFGKRMGQSNRVLVSAVYVAASLMTSSDGDEDIFCNQAISGTPCYLENKFWFLPNSAQAWVSDIAIPIGMTASNVVGKILPACDYIMNAKLRNTSSVTALSPENADRIFNGSRAFNNIQQQNLLTSFLLQDYKQDYFDLFHPDAGKQSLADYDYPQLGYDAAVALSKPGRILCHNRLTDDSASSSSLLKNDPNPRIRSQVIPVVPIITSKSDTIFMNDMSIETCVLSESEPLPSTCRVDVAETYQCGKLDLRVSKDYSFLLNSLSWLGFSVAIVSSIALLFGASAIMIAIDAQLLAVISQGSCASVTAKPATKFLQQFLFLGRAVEEDENSAEYYSTVVAWMIGVVAVAISLHGLTVVLVSFVRRRLLLRRKGGKGAQKLSTIDRLFGKLYQLAASSAREKQRKAEKLQSSKFFLEERRVLARTAAALRFPSASLLVLLVALQGLWFSAVNVWWYSTTPIESMPGIVGCLFALLLTLIILVLAKNTRLIFQTYTWLHPERIEQERREQAIEVSLAVHLRSLVSFKRSWFFPYGAWGPARPRQRMGTLFLPVKSRGWIGVPFLVSLLTCLTVSFYPLTVLGCCAQQMFLSLFFFSVALIVWKSQPMRAPYANTMFVVVRGSLAILTFCRTIFLVTSDQYFDAAYFLTTVLVQTLILVVGVVDIWCGLAEHFIWLPHLEYRQDVIRARTGGALRLQREHEEGGSSFYLHNQSSNGNNNPDGKNTSGDGTTNKNGDPLSKGENATSSLDALLQSYGLDKDDDDDDDDAAEEDTDDDLMFYPGQHHAVMKQRENHKNNLSNGSGGEDGNDARKKSLASATTTASKTADVHKNFLEDDDDDDDVNSLLAVEMDKI